VALVGLSATVLQPAASQPNANEKQVRICHATGSATNPYNSIEPAIANNGDLVGGHLNHTGPVFPAAVWGDIIPPYTYVDASGNTQVFGGYNWSSAGQAIWQNEAGVRDVPRLHVEVAAERRFGPDFPTATTALSKTRSPAIRRTSIRRSPTWTTMRFTAGRRSTRSPRTQPRRPFGRPGRLSSYRQAPSAARCARTASTTPNWPS
jgi:hypothetical protein